jgi:hypothetical protein
MLSMPKKKQELSCLLLTLIDLWSENSDHHCSSSKMEKPMSTDTRTTRVRWESQEEGVIRTAASFPQ